MLKITSLNKKFGNSTIFLNCNISFEDKIIAIKGKSGIGKSTLLGILGLLESYNGTYYIDDILIDKKNKEKIRKEKFTYVFQNPLLLPYLSVYENMIMVLKNEKKEIDKEHVLDIAKKLEIDNIVEKKASLISGGEAVRVAIARAILSKKKYILADEPTGSLDPETAESVMSLFIKVANETDSNIIMVTHSNMFDSCFDKIYYIDKGNVYEK